MADDRGVDKKKDETGETDKSDKVHGFSIELKLLARYNLSDMGECWNR